MMKITAALECFLCERAHPIGVRIGPVWCCIECEARIVRTEVGGEEYDELVAGMRRFWHIYGEQRVP